MPVASISFRREESGYSSACRRICPDAPGVYAQACGTHLPTASQEDGVEKPPACFQTAVRKLNLAPEDGDSLYAVTLHTMRHTFASWLAQSGKVTLMELQKLMRHKNTTMTMRYAHLFPGQESEKLSIIGDMLA